MGHEDATLQAPPSRPAQVVANTWAFVNKQSAACQP
jgi:hypothetical protein